MTNQELQQQFQLCDANGDADGFDALALAYHARGYVDNAARCFRKADDLRGCAFAEAMPARLAVREEVG
jgi:cytochrome c-type biogenesis protein CcmH/NrfG